MINRDLESLMHPMQYRLAQAERREAYEKLNYANASLELARIKERFAELYSQFDPVNKINNMKLDEREKLCATAYYIMMGRLPEEEK